MSSSHNCSKDDISSPGVINDNHGAGFTKFTAYRNIFDNEERIFMQMDDYTFSESYEITLGNGKTIYKKLKAGFAADCYDGFFDGQEYPARGSFSLDLTGTELAFDESVKWKSYGWRHVGCFSEIGS